MHWHGRHRWAEKGGGLAGMGWAGWLAGWIKIRIWSSSMTTGHQWRLAPCSYLSQSFNIMERNYEIYDRELLAIIQALTEWRHYLLRSPHPVTVLLDHKNLTYFQTAQKLNRQQAR